MKATVIVFIEYYVGLKLTSKNILKMYSITFIFDASNKALLKHFIEV